MPNTLYNIFLQGDVVGQVNLEQTDQQRRNEHRRILAKAYRVPVHYMRLSRVTHMRESTTIDDLRSAQSRQKYTKAQMAEQIGVSKEEYKSWLTGEREIPHWVSYRLSQLK